MIASAKRRRRRRPKPPMTCEDLARQGRWDQSLCCPDCHRDPDHWLIWQTLTALNPLEGRHEAFICCFCIDLIDDWYPGKVITIFPEHEE
jgi:hypothetical protein